MGCYRAPIQNVLVGKKYALSEYRELEYSVGDYWPVVADQASSMISRRSDLRGFQPRLGQPGSPYCRREAFAAPLRAARVVGQPAGRHCRGALADGLAGLIAIHTARRREHQSPAAGRAHRVQQGERAADVRLPVAKGACARLAHSSACGEVTYAVDAVQRGKEGSRAEVSVGPLHTFEQGRRHGDDGRRSARAAGSRSSPARASSSSRTGARTSRTPAVRAPDQREPRSLRPRSERRGANRRTCDDTTWTPLATAGVVQDPPSSTLLGVSLSLFRRVM